MAMTPCSLLPGSSRHNDVALRDFTAGVASSGRGPEDTPSITAGIPRGPPAGADTLPGLFPGARPLALGSVKPVGCPGTRVTSDARCDSRLIRNRT